MKLRNIIEGFTEKILVHQMSPNVSRKTLVSCKACGSANIKLYKCGKCQNVVYCSDKCQFDDWIDHEKQCK